MFNYESLDDEKFQKLAQAILSQAFPTLQCLPVGQPDGGRDAFVLSPAESKRGLLAFQVKFSRHPETKTERDAIEELVKTEASKVKKLKAKGLESYYLLTNVRGSSHPEVGSIDRVNAVLTQAFDVPSYVWWRDDLDARISGASDVKWSFPDIIKGSDLLQKLLELSGDAAERRSAALRSYIATQHNDDQDVKFKQVELQNRLLDLFVDSPIARTGHQASRRSKWDSVPREGTAEYIFQDDAGVIYEDGQARRFYRGGKGLNAAEFFLGLSIEHGVTGFVLEGAPGQGKSTITQYLCQVNRIKLLGHGFGNEGLREIAGPVRVPFRIDLRDYAVWVNGRSPFGSEGRQPLPAGSSAGLESFLAAQIAHLSGGHGFDASDFAATARSSHVLIVLDGFDEVADVPTRRLIVDEITRAAARFKATALSAHVIVTSRPAAFGNSPGFSEDSWLHLSLQALLSSQVSEYAKKWMVARRLPSKERAEFSRLLDEKLEQPHMRELSRNPMQLTILLALIHTRGLSLPDKRTSLYDNYMDLFFSRESEKSRVVREHRDLLIDIHRYLAWILQTEAEAGKTAGSITEPELRQLLRSYLISEGQPEAVLDQLFTGMVERVVALVSRVEGTYEFEVQPLREYFAARHLYETAPYSPPGAEVGGTKPDRFDALARNFYWLNVTRFYCGCYSRGELSSLVDGLVELEEDPDYCLISHPRVLSSMLLSDWVFTQQPNLIGRLIREILERPGWRLLLSGQDGTVQPASLVLPERCGRVELVDKLYEALEGQPALDERHAIYAVIRNNTSVEERTTRWRQRQASLQASGNWTSEAESLGILGTLSISDLEVSFKEAGKEGAEVLARTGRIDALLRIEGFLDYVVEGILSASGLYLLGDPEERMASPLYALSTYTAPFGFGELLSSDRAMPARHALRRMYPGFHRARAEAASPITSNALLDKVSAFVERAELILDSPVKDWASSLGHWKQFAAVVFESWGECAVLDRLSLASSSVKSTLEPGYWYGFSTTDPQERIESLRFARLKSSEAWWREHLSAVGSETSKRLALSTFVLWTPPKVMSALSPELNKLLATLDVEQWNILLRLVRQTSNSTQGARRPLHPKDVSLLSGMSGRAAVLISLRGKQEFQRAMYDKFLSSLESEDKGVLRFILDVAVASAGDDEERWRDALEKVSLGYTKHGIVSVSAMRQRSMTMPTAAAQEVCSRLNHFPLSLIRIAEARLAESRGAASQTLRDAAAIGHWF